MHNKRIRKIYDKEGNIRFEHEAPQRLVGAQQVAYIAAIAIKKGISLRDCKLEGVDFRNADIKGARFDGSDMRYTNFKDKDISATWFENCDLSNTIFDGAKARFASFNNAKLDDASMSGDFEHAQFKNVKLSFAQKEAMKKVQHKKEQRLRK